MRPPRKTQWKAAELRRHLRSSALKGVVTWGGERITAEAIISPADWNRLQKRLDETKLRTPRNIDEWPLTGRVRCSCGGHLVGAGRRGADKKRDFPGYRYYRCDNHTQDEAGLCRCDHDKNPGRPRWWTAELLEGAAWDWLILHLADEGNLERAAKKYLGLTAKEAPDPKVINAVKKTVTRAEAGYAEALANIGSAPAKERKVREAAAGIAKERWESHLAELARLEAAARDAIAAEGKVKLWLDKAKEVSALYDLIEPGERKKLIIDLDATWEVITRAKWQELQIRDLPEDPRSEPTLVQWIELVDFTLRPPVYTEGGSTTLLR